MKIDVLGVNIDNLKKIEVINKISGLIDHPSLLKTGKPVFIVTPYSEFIVAAQKDPEFRNILNSADIALPDGVGILWAAKYLSLPLKFSIFNFQFSKYLLACWRLVYSLSAVILNPQYIRSPIPEKISGSEFIWDLAGLSAKNNYSIFLLGGHGETPELVAQKLKVKYPNLKIAGVGNPVIASPNPKSGRGNPIAEEMASSPLDVLETPRNDRLATTQDLIQKINSSSADFLFVALGPITQEKWIYRNLPNLRVKLAIGLGGTFDYLAGKRPLAPNFLRFTGLEWLWRLVTQPWRVLRITKGVIGLIYFCYKSKIIN